ncbi:hypothetical protein A2U01_0015088, partial [Trifolium medium]|nr:hypothetical protein [Trifolium medium]
MPSAACELLPLLMECKEGSWCEAPRREVRDYCCRPNTRLLKYKGGSFPTKTKMKNFKPIARAWAGFYVRNMDSVSNHSEYQIENAVAVKAILEGKEIDLGRVLSQSLKAITQNKACKRHDGDEYLEPVKALTGAWLYKWKVRPVTSDTETDEDEDGNDDEEGDDLEDDIDRFDGGAHMNQGEPNVGVQLPDFQGPEVEYYDKESEKWKQAMEYRKTVAPSAFYPRYPTEAAYVAGQERRMRQYKARQESNLEIYRRIKLASDDGCMDFVHDSRAAEATPSHLQPMDQ